MQKNIGILPVTLVVCPAGQQFVISQLSSANTTNLPVTCSVTVTRGATTIFILNSATIPAGSSLICAGESQKIVLMAGDILRVQSNTASSIDAMVSGVINDFGGAAAVPAVPASPVATFAITPSTTSTFEGGTVTYTVATTNVPNGTEIYWENVGTTTAQDFTDDRNNGAITITGGAGSFTRTLKNNSQGGDPRRESLETIQMALQFRPGIIGGGAVAGASTVTVAPDIVTSGLIMLLDAGDSTSYSGLGTSWADLSGSGNNGTLIAGPTYNSANSGFLTFDGTDDYVNTALTYQNASAYTMSTWIRTSVAQLCGLIGFRRSFVNPNWFQSQIYITGNNTANTVGSFLNIDEFNLNFPTFTAQRNIFYNTSITTGNWINIALTSNNVGITLYINGAQVAQNNTTPTPIRYDPVTFHIGAAGNFPNPPLAGYYFNGNMSNVSFYNRDLSAVEIAQNFNAVRGRFGV